MEEKKISNYKQFEWFGVITAIIYSLFVALNIGLEFFGFLLLYKISKAEEIILNSEIFFSISSYAFFVA